jgi:hypothetical protein
MIATATKEAVSLLNINDNGRNQMPTNCLAQLLVTTRRVTADDTQRHQEQTAIEPRKSNILARLLVTTRDVTLEDTPLLRHCDFPDSSVRVELQMAA